MTWSVSDFGISYLGDLRDLRRATIQKDGSMFLLLKYTRGEAEPRRAYYAKRETAQGGGERFVKDGT